VSDVVDANLRAADSDAVGPFNIGVGKQVSVLDLVEALDDLGEDGFSFEHAPPRPGEVQHIALDCSRAAEELGWSAQVELSEGLDRTLSALR
jgi:UDP-glucose 4-epimerase